MRAKHSCFGSFIPFFLQKHAFWKFSLRPHFEGFLSVLDIFVAENRGNKVKN